ncbi:MULTISPECIES: sigma-54-dependent transcriptional regulator [unclassified Haematospirillum]|uniref:sigma-54-dependent transcriptional regulator n=1 Tax=unclassified Haematospirillum TaxID=2622088 RepID=UPI00143BEA9A|nr:MULTISPECIES: sigma-54 dependent transcriptional regulator [unclassified Haematospirillum]NKD54464.1 sigma-54-dependent Fis family transcriptional regulator [Haematospirillum sp. H4890]NKD74507.1 sigma-54-dependent Fis family transcriptional regulator [Haematospirillum sp. H4485]
MRLLIVGSLGGQIGAASQIAMRRGAKVSQADDIHAALTQLRGGHGADLMMVDIGLDIRLLVASLESERISVPVVACGVSTDTKAAVEAIRAGAKEYVPLPPDPELIAAVLAAVVQQDNTIIFRDPSMQKIMDLANQVAPSEAGILIVGESGTGKELVARHIHQKSRRANRVFVAVNCAAIPENLLESELFGHEKGAFTGAIARRIGKFEEATGGTLLLDEISEIDVRLQAKLLRVLQERELTRVGGNQSVKVDVRILATSNRNLQEEVRKGRFREDLFFRLNVVTLSLPPLRDRPRDIEILAKHFAEKYASLNKVPARPIAANAMESLQRHIWRGNVRELENTIHRSVLLARGDTIDRDAILLTEDGENVPNPGGSIGTLVGRTVADVERDLIIDTLRHTLGNRTHAANILGISIRTLRNKLRLYTDQGLPVPPPTGGEADVPA